MINPLQSVLGNIGTLHIKQSIITPLLWLFGICSVCFFPMVIFVPALLWLAYIPVLLLLFIMGIYVFLMIKDPNRLQSEHYQLQNNLMLMQGENGAITIDNSELIANPSLVESSPNDPAPNNVGD